MISVSNDFKNAMKAPVKVVGAQIAIQDGATYTSGGDLVKAEVQSSGYFFGVATKTLTFTLLGTSYSLMEKLANVTLKVQTDASNDTWESCDLGAFQIVEQKIDLEKGMSNFKAYDAVGIAGLKPYATGGLNFPCTVDNLAVQVASVTNMSYNEGSLVNGTYTITEDLYSNISNLTYRDILAEVAGASASLASVSGVGSSLSFRNPSTTPLETLTYSNLKTFKLQPKYGDVNTVVLARTPQEDNVVVYPYSEATGESLNIDDAGGSLKAVKKIEGGTSQQTYTGKNLLNYTVINQTTRNGVTCSYDAATQTIMFNGTCDTDNTTFAFVGVNNLPLDGTYTLSYEVVSGTITNPPTTTRIQLQDSNQGWRGMHAPLKQSSGSSTATLSSLACNSNNVRFDNGVVVNNYKIRIQLEKSSSATAWERYVGGVPAPSPNYPQRVNTVSGLNFFRFCNGKNLSEVKEGSYAYGSTQTWSIANGVITTTRTGTSAQGGSLNLSDGAVSQWAFAEDQHLTSNGGTYTLTVRKSGTITTASNGYTRITAYIYRDGAMTSHRNVLSNITNDTTTISISLAADEHVGCITHYSQYVEFTNLELRVQLEAGSSSTSFTPYDGQRYEVNLITGKNLIDASKFGTMMAKGLTLESTADGTIRITGTSTASGHFSIPFKLPQSLVGQTAVFSVTGTFGNLSDVGPKAGTSANGFTVGSATHVVNTLTQQRVDNMTTLDIWYQSGRTISAEIKVQFEISSTKTAWERFTSIELAEMGDLKSYIYPSNGDWFIHKDCTTRIFDGTETWQELGTSTSGVKRFRTSVSDIKTSIQSVGFSNLLKKAPGDTYYYDGISGSTGAYIYIRDAVFQSMDAAGVKAWIAENPLRAVYELGTPTDTKITDANLVAQLNALSSAALYGKGTIMTSLPGDLAAPIVVDYYRERDNLCEVKLANNEILDDNREALGEPIFEAVDGFGFYPFEATTEGHGWHEIGDRIAVTDGSSTWDIIITDIKLTIDGGIKEELRGVAPTETTTNYALAGGIKKSIYNTEIKVDKQGQEITSIVSRQDEFEGQTLANFSQISQNISSVVTTIQTTGGGNLVHNSVGYNRNTDRTLANWTQSGTISSETSPESASYGAISGNQINLGASSSITQRITVDNSGDQKYTLGFKAKKGATGVATIHLRNGTDDYKVTIPDGSSVLWESYSLTGLIPHDTYFDVVIETNASVTEFAITDLMLNIGDSTTPWVSASDEILSKSVAVDGSGVTVRSSSSNDYTQLDEQGLNGYSDASGSLENVFTINRDLTEVSKLKARKQIEMPPLKIVPITSGDRAGWSFVKQEDN